jgi:hypothetical protein
VESYYEAWLPRKLGTVASATYRDYKQHLDHYVIPRIGGLPLESIVRERSRSFAQPSPTSIQRRASAAASPTRRSEISSARP